MQTRVDAIQDGIYRLSTCVPDAVPGGFTFNQFLVIADEPLLFHTGPRQLFPLVSEAASKVLELSRLRWIAFGHVEADECGSVNEWLKVAPHAQVAHGAVGCMTSLNDLCDRPPRALADGEVIDLGGKRVRHIDTPHVPHNWEARVLFEETTRTLLAGDLFTHTGDGPPTTTADIVAPAMAAEEIFGATAPGSTAGATLRKLAALEPRLLAVMHGSSYEGDGAKALEQLAAAYDARFAELHRAA